MVAVNWEDWVGERALEGENRNFWEAMVICLFNGGFGGLLLRRKKIIGESRNVVFKRENFSGSKR